MKVFFILMIAMCLGSCMRVSDLGEHTTFLRPKPITQSVEAAVSEPYFRLGQWPSLQWWTQFQSDELNQLIEQALKENPSVQSVWQKVEVAKQIAKKTKAPLFPFIFFNAKEDWGELSRNNVPYEYNPSLGSVYDTADLKLSFQYEFDFWGKYRNKFKAALGEAKSQKAEAKQVELMISTTLAKVFFALKTNLRRKELYQELYLVRTNILGLNDLLYNKAIKSKIKTASALESLEEIKKEILALDEEILANIHFINTLRGKSPDLKLSLEQNLNPVPEALELPKEISSDLIARRPDLIAAIWHIESLAYEFNVAVADFFPRVDLLGFLGMGSIGFKNLLDWRSSQARLQPSIHIPIFKAGEIRANARKNKAALEGAIYSYNELLLRSLKEVADGLIVVTKSYKQKKAQEIILDQASLKLKLLELNFEKGIDGLLGVYEMQEELIKRQLQDTLITYHQYASLIQVIKALGGGYSSVELKHFQKGGQRDE